MIWNTLTLMWHHSNVNGEYLKLNLLAYLCLGIYMPQECVYQYRISRSAFADMYYCAVLCYAQMIEYIQARWSYLFVCTSSHYDHYADLHEGIELLKCLSGIFCLEDVSRIKSIFSIICNAIYGAVRIQLTHFSYDDCENTGTLSFYHHPIGSMTLSPQFRVSSWNNGMRCMSF